MEVRGDLRCQDFADELNMHYIKYIFYHPLLLFLKLPCIYNTNWLDILPPTVYDTGWLSILVSSTWSKSKFLSFFSSFPLPVSDSNHLRDCI